MDRNDPRYGSYISILKEELIPAMGCTEPIALAYAAAKARAVLGDMPERIKAEVSGMYIVSARDSKGKKLYSDQPPKKKGWWARTIDKLQEKAGAKPVK